VHDWTLTWTGFDVILTLTIFSTALLAFLRRRLVILAAVVSGTLMIGDAWFDITTSSGGDRIVALVFAFLLELPFAAFLFRAAFRLLRLSSQSVVLEPGVSLWRMPIRTPLPGGELA